MCFPARHCVTYNNWKWAGCRPEPSTAGGPQKRTNLWWDFLERVQKGLQQAVPPEGSLPSCFTWVKPGNSCLTPLPASPCHSELIGLVPGSCWDFSLWWRHCRAWGSTLPWSLCLSCGTFKAVPKAGVGHKWQCSQVFKVLLKKQKYWKLSFAMQLVFESKPKETNPKNKSQLFLRSAALLGGVGAKKCCHHRQVFLAFWFWR